MRDAMITVSAYLLTTSVIRAHGMDDRVIDSFRVNAI